MDVKLKYYKKNKIDKFVFIINSDICINTYNFFKKKYTDIGLMPEVKFNPIFQGGKNNAFFITFSNSTSFYKFDQHCVYKFQIIIKKYNKKYINVFITGSDPIKCKDQNYEILN